MQDDLRRRNVPIHHASAVAAVRAVGQRLGDDGPALQAGLRGSARIDGFSARGAAVGTVRVSCTAALGVRYISRLIFAFQDRHPGITVDLSLMDERVDLVREGVDIAIRLGPLADSSMRLRTLGTSRRILVGAPEYLARHGRPATSGDLTNLDGIRMSNIAGSEALTLEGPNGETHVVPFDGRLRVDHGLAAREAYLAGRGIGPAHLWLVDDLLSEGQLEPVLPDYAPPPVSLNMLIVPERADIARVRLLVEFLAGEVLSIPGIDRGPVEARRSAAGVDPPT